MTDLHSTYYDPATPIGVVGRDEYIVEQEEFGYTRPQSNAKYYLLEVLEQLYRNEGWLVALNFDHHHAVLDNAKKLIVPDVAVFKGITVSEHDQTYLSSWDMRGGKSCPPVMFEISSGSTYPGDIELDNKPRLYGLIGVKEFFA